MTETFAVLGSLGEFVGAILIAATLVYLAIQTSATSKNVEILKNQNIADTLGRFNEKLAESHETAEIWLKGTRGADQLSPVEEVRFNSLWVLWNTFARILWESGERDPRQYLGWVRLLSFPGVRKKFDSSHALPEELKQYLTNLYAENFSGDA